MRAVDPHPFVPSDPATRDERCEEIFHTQVAALGRRLAHIGTPPVSIGVSGGLDSTLALLVVCKTLDALGVPRDRDPGADDARLRHHRPDEGQRPRPDAGARRHASARSTSAPMCLEQMQALGHAPFGIELDGETVDSLTEKLRHLPPDNRSDLAFENVQARVRTRLLMNAGFVIGTGDLSELALGLVYLQRRPHEHVQPERQHPEDAGEVPGALGGGERVRRRRPRDAARHRRTPRSRRNCCRPTRAATIAQSTEGDRRPLRAARLLPVPLPAVRRGAGEDPVPGRARDVRQAVHAGRVRAAGCAVFLTRFFANQFKRWCLPDGPKVGSVSLSPRGDWRMPSDAAARVWLDCASITVPTLTTAQIEQAREEIPPVRNVLLRRPCAAASLMMGVTQRVLHESRFIG